MSNDDIERIEAENARGAIDQALELLGEHYGAVQILASHETVNGDTVSAYFGKGNWHARVGMAHDFIDRDSAQNFAWEMKSDEEE